MDKTERVKKRRLQLTQYAIHKRQPKTIVEYYKVTVADPNFATGKNNLTRSVFVIKGITFDVSDLHKFEYDIGYLAANKNFTYGGFYQPGDRVLLIDCRTQLENVEIELKDYFVIDSKRYDIQQLQEIDYKTGWVIHLRHTSGTKTNRIITANVIQRLTPTQETTHD